MTHHDDHVLPRPVERLPEYANARARTNAAQKLEELFELGPEAARLIADAAIDPAELRKVAEAPERIPVPGGTLLGLRTAAWARRVSPDPRNPRLGPSRRHPFAVDPGTAEDCRFSPVPEPSSVGLKAELQVEIESREHLTWAVDQSRQYILADNDWRTSIRGQGVMTEVWATVTAYQHGDGSPDLWTLTTAEGSSRMTAEHDILEERSVDLAYDVDDRRLRTLIRRYNQGFDRGPTANDMVSMRCEIVPILFLVGFDPHPGGTEDFATAVKSMVALRHVDPPKPWGEGPEMEALADAVLEEMQRRGVLAPDRRKWIAGGITRAEAERSHLSPLPAVRAAAIVALLLSDEDDVREAIRVAITAQSTRKKITSKLLNQLATALIVRSVSTGGNHGDRIRRYMQHAFAKPLHQDRWVATSRSSDELIAAALSEAKDGGSGESSLELAARGAYPLIAELRLWGDRGTQNNEQPDRRTPGEVIDTMRRTERGVRQLGQALKDQEAGHKIRVVDDAGKIVWTDDGAQERHVNDSWLRQAFPPAGTIKSPASPSTAHERLQAKLADLASAVEALETSITDVKSIEGIEGTALVDTAGVDRRHTGAWRETLVQASDILLLWGAKWNPNSAASDEGMEDALDADSSEAQGSEIARKAAVKAVATKRASGTLVTAAQKAVETKRDKGTLSEAAHKAHATRAERKAAAQATGTESGV